jgi:hypothetical protein
MSDPDGGRSRLTSRSHRPQRVRVTSPRMTAVARPPYRPATGEIDEDTEVGEVYMTALLRSQLLPGLAVLVVVVIALGGLPVLFTLLPGISDIHVGPIPLPWVLLGVAVYPMLLAVAWWHVLAAERGERAVTDILRRR